MSEKPTSSRRLARRNALFFVTISGILQEAACWRSTVRSSAKLFSLSESTKERELFPGWRLENDILRLMRRSAVWFLIAVLWLVIAVIAALHQGWQRAWLQTVVAIMFFIVAVYFRRKERIR